MPLQTQTMSKRPIWIDKIDAALERMGQSRYWLANRIGKHPSRLSQWSNGQGEPDMTLALQIARILDVPLEWLADDEATSPPPPARS